MQQRTLGHGGPQVGAVGLGCMSFAGVYGGTDLAESHRTLAAALELGVTHLDTALIYGNGLSEEVIGAFIKDHPGRFSIATKGGIRTQPTRSFDNSEAYLRDCLEGSLRRLGVEHVDLYYIHRRDQTIPIEEVTGTLSRFVEEGKIGGIGYSEIAPASLERAAAVHPVRAVQSEYSLWTRLPELGMLQACARLGTAFVAFSPVGRGIFGETPLDPSAFSDKDFRKNNPRFVEPNYSANEAFVARLRDYARSRGWSVAALAIAWTLAKWEHVISIPGTRSPEHLAVDASAADIALTAEDLAAIDAILPPGFAHGDRYSDAQALGPERYC
ncbi:aldo/keto reductase [Mangrovibrevibacter kandeliae]|uniref:aldo/keto reductase n=1 Tax=Mangrovibrevibacter kandeliae TaxID=2968473 RepID=UPI00211961E0|nr:aldo/keto reductase [Aurantimonas sp. CSK15Z-1]MCQ8781783.1 aldo/keto reductase [Aurantimonas sp. CSK15Z-1]